MLLAWGADATLADHDGATPFMVAAGQGHVGVLERLLYYQPIIPMLKTAQDRIGYTALYYACQEGHEEAAQLLLLHGSKPMVPNAYSMTPLIMAPRRGNLALTRSLLDHSEVVAVNAQDREGRTALWHALQQRHDQLVEVLLEV